MGLSRRRLLIGAGATSGLATAGGLLRPTRATPVHAAAAGPVVPLGPAADLLDPRLSAHVARRLSLRPTDTLVDEIEATGVNNWIRRQLKPWRIPENPTLATRLADIPFATASDDELLAALQDIRAARDNGEPMPTAMHPAKALLVETVIRALHDDQHLVRTMVDFWSDHLNVHAGHDASTALGIPLYMREVLRPYAIGRFDKMLLNCLRSPAMLTYLDNHRSTKSQPNENHARELLELHTVGVGSHTEADVAAAARVLTGWTVNRATITFSFRPKLHDFSPATVVGFTTDGGQGMVDGQDLVSHLAHHPATAATIARRLVRRFVSDVPDPDLEGDLAEIYLANDTHVRPVLEALFDSDAFRTSLGTKVRRPFAYVMAALAAHPPDLPNDERAFRTGAGRQAHLPSTPITSIADELIALGHVPHEWPAPDGYPDHTGAWVSAAAALARWHASSTIAQIQDEQGLLPDTVDDALDVLPARVLLRDLTSAERADISQAAGSSTTPVAAAVALVLDHPGMHVR